MEHVVNDFDGERIAVLLENKFERNAVQLLLSWENSRPGAQGRTGRVEAETTIGCSDRKTSTVVKSRSAYLLDILR